MNEMQLNSPVHSLRLSLSGAGRVFHPREHAPHDLARTHGSCMREIIAGDAQHKLTDPLQLSNARKQSARNGFGATALGSARAPPLVCKAVGNMESLALFRNADRGMGKRDISSS